MKSTAGRRAARAKELLLDVLGQQNSGLCMYVCLLGRGERGFMQVLFFSEKKSH